MGKRKEIAHSSIARNVLYVCVCIAITLFIFLSTRGINLPYVGYNAWNYNTYSLIAHNYNTFGWIPTKLAPIISVSQKPPLDPQYYLHHPPLLSIMEAIFFNIFGESFTSGRMTVIFFSTFSLIVLFAAARELNGKTFALISSICYSLVPASVLFGRMIGQEALVLSFALCSLYCMLRYDKTKAKKYFVFCVIATILGVLSDWPMIYFTASVFPWLWYKKQKKLALTIVITAIITGVFYLGYIYWIMDGFADLFQAITVRSLGQLTQLAYWPVVWIAAIIIRILFYFNPLVILGIVTGFFIYKKFEISKEQKMLLGCLLLWGGLHIVFFPEGSFGHPYWIYYLLPSIVLCSAYIILRFYQKKYYVLLVVLFLISLGYLIKIEDWKTKEIKGNIWRYNLAQLVSQHIPRYTSFILHPSSPIDYDLLQYAFMYPVQVKDQKMIRDEDKGKKMVYVCPSLCLKNNELLQLTNAYKFNNYKNSNGEMYVFMLHSPLQNQNKIQVSTNTPAITEEQSIHPVKRLYLFILKTTHMPQL